MRIILEQLTDLIPFVNHNNFTIGLILGAILFVPILGYLLYVIKDFIPFGEDEKSDKK